MERSCERFPEGSPARSGCDAAFEAAYTSSFAAAHGEARAKAYTASEPKAFRHEFQRRVDQGEYRYSFLILAPVVLLCLSVGVLVARAVVAKGRHFGGLRVLRQPIPLAALMLALLLGCGPGGPSWSDGYTLGAAVGAAQGASAGAERGAEEGTAAGEAAGRRRAAARLDRGLAASIYLMPAATAFALGFSAFLALAFFGRSRLQNGKLPLAVAPLIWDRVEEDPFYRLAQQQRGAAEIREFDRTVAAAVEAELIDPVPDTSRFHGAHRA